MRRETLCRLSFLRADLIMIAGKKIARFWLIPRLAYTRWEGIRLRNFARSLNVALILSLMVCHENGKYIN